MIYDPILFAKYVQKILVGNYEPIMGICVKIFIINLHNLQVLFRGGDRSPKTYESMVVHHNFLQFGKQDSRYKPILSSIVL